MARSAEAALVAEQREALLETWAEHWRSVDEFRDVELPSCSSDVVTALVSALEEGDNGELAPHRALSRTADRLATETPSVGILARQLSVLHAALAETLKPVLPAEGSDALSLLGTYVTQLLGLSASSIAAKIEREASRNYVTGLLAKKAFNQDGRRALADARKFGTRLVVVSIDLAGLREVNNKQGHLAGDQLLKSMARALVDAIGATDSAYHVSGDEFAALLRDRDVGEVIAKVAEQAPNFDWGMATAEDEADDFEALFDLADIRMGAEKEERKSRAAETP